MPIELLWERRTLLSRFSPLDLDILFINTGATLSGKSSVPHNCGVFNKLLNVSLDHGIYSVRIAYNLH